MNKTTEESIQRVPKARNSASRSTRRLRRTRPAVAVPSPPGHEPPLPEPIFEASRAGVDASIPSVDEINGKWKKEVQDAGVAWSRLTEDDLLKLEGHAATLAELVKQRYGVSRHEADKQVMSFIEDHQAASL